MIIEYIRLTNIAFGIVDNTPPVFLPDEIQSLCGPTDLLSTYYSDGTFQNHSQLSLLLAQLAGQIKPVCICTGTNSGNIISIAGNQAIIPQVLYLTPLVSEYEEFWKQLTAYSNQSFKENSEIEMESDKDLIDALAYHSCQVPRLLSVAHYVWFELRRQGTAKSREFYIQAFAKEAIIYYAEMVQILNEFTSETIAHILFACGVHWIVDNAESNVPGTNIPWVTLIRRSCVFPYLDGSYMFPFSLVWRVATTSPVNCIQNKELSILQCTLMHHLIFQTKMRSLNNI